MTAIATPVGEATGVGHGLTGGGRHTAELLRALATLAEPPGPHHAAIAGALGLDGVPSAPDHADLFLFAAYPYASVYLGAEGMLGGEGRDRVAGFWRALGLTPPPEPDHLTALLGMYASLVEAEAEAEAEAAAAADAAPRGDTAVRGDTAAPRHDGSRLEILRRTRAAFLWEHLLSWAPFWLRKVEEIADPYHRSWARLLGESLLDDAAGVAAPSALPLALREAPGLPEDAAPGRDWVAALLAPVRSGVLVTRADLARAGRELGLGGRVGERAFMLRTLFEQDAAATTGWLAREASRAAESHQAMEAALGPVAAFWRRRAHATVAAMLRVRPDHGKAVDHGG